MRAFLQYSCCFYSVAKLLGCRIKLKRFPNMSKMCVSNYTQCFIGSTFYIFTFTNIAFFFAKITKVHFFLSLGRLGVLPKFPIIPISPSSHSEVATYLMESKICSIMYLARISRQKAPRTGGGFRRWVTYILFNRLG